MKETTASRHMVAYRAMIRMAISAALENGCGRASTHPHEHFWKALQDGTKDKIIGQHGLDLILHQATSHTPRRPEPATVSQVMILRTPGAANTHRSARYDGRHSCDSMRSK